MSGFDWQRVRGKVKVWRDLLSFSRSRFVRVSLVWVTLVPILAKATQAMDNTVNIVIGPKTHVFTLALPFSWILFYFGALAFLAGNLIVGWRCPRILKETRNFRDFTDQGRAVSELRTYVKWLIPVGARTAQDIERVEHELETIEATISDNLLRKATHRIEYIDHALASAYQFVVYDGADWFHFYSRLAAHFAYLLGGFFYLLVVIQSSRFVVQNLPWNG